MSVANLSRILRPPVSRIADLDVRARVDAALGAAVDISFALSRAGAHTALAVVLDG